MPDPHSAVRKQTGNGKRDWAGQTDLPLRDERGEPSLFFIKFLPETLGR